MARHCVAYYTHYVSEIVKREVARLAAELPDDYDLWVFGCCENETALDELQGGRVRTKTYTRNDLRLLPYPAKLATVNWITLRQSSDLAPMRFFRDFPDYDYYWLVEYDVRYTGNWADIFSDLRLSSADLLCSYITTHAQAPDWMHWESLNTCGEIVKTEDYVRGFLPFSRISSRLAEAIHIRYRRNWVGHNEALWPTIAKAENFSIEEIGGRLAPRQRVGKYYHGAVFESTVFLSTFAAWPYYSDKSVFSATAIIENVLWHPVKE